MLQQGSELLCGGPSSASCTEPCCPSSPEPQASPATYTQHEKQHVDPETSFRDCWSFRAQTPWLEELNLCSWPGPRLLTVR